MCTHSGAKLACRCPKFFGLPAPHSIGPRRAQGNPRDPGQGTEGGEQLFMQMRGRGRHADEGAWAGPRKRDGTPYKSSRGHFPGRITKVAAVAGGRDRRTDGRTDGAGWGRSQQPGLDESERRCPGQEPTPVQRL